MLNNNPNPLRAAYPELDGRTAIEALQNPAIAGAAAGLPVFTGPGGVVEAKTAEAARAAIGAAPALQADVTVYVSPTGSDTEGDGSQEAPYFSINKAVAGLPKNLNGHTAIIDMAAGTYNYTSQQGVSDFVGGAIKISGKYTGTGASAAPSTIIDFGDINGGLYITYNFRCLIDNIKIYCKYQSLRVSGSICAIWLLQADGRGGASSTGIYADYGSTVFFLWDSQGRTGSRISNCTYGMQVNQGGMLTAYYAIGGSGNKLACAAMSGIVSAPGLPEGETRYQATGGGRIFVGAQTSVPNY